MTELEEKKDNMGVKKIPPLEKDEKTGFRIWRPGYILKPGETISRHKRIGKVVTGGKK